MVLMCIPLMAGDAEHLFVHVLIICISPLEKCLFRSFSHLKIGLLGFFAIELYVFWVLSLCQFLPSNL